MAADEQPGSEDLTAKARLRDAALRLFAERGIQGTTVRDVAAAAGVSGGLVRHHFGSKEDLRAACDAYALRRLVQVKSDVVLGERPASPEFLSWAHPTIRGLVRYVARSVLDGSPAAAAMFSQLVESTQEWLAANPTQPVSDPRAHAALFVAAEIGALVTGPQLSQALGADVSEADGELRLARAKVEFYSTPLLTPEVAARALDAIDHLQHETGSPR